MRIDRSRFLLLASAISAGCGPRREATPPPTTVSDADAGAPAPVATAAPPKAPHEGAVVGDAWSVSEGPPPSYEGGGGYWPPGEGYPTPANEGGWTPPPTAEGSGPTSLKAMGIPVQSWTCSGSDDVGKPAYCSVQVPKSCAPFPFVNQNCRGARKYFKPKIAERAVQCMHKLTPNAVCSAMTYECREAAMKSACPDPAADIDCQAMAKKCPKVSVSECKQYMSALNAAGRSEVIKCMTTGGGCGYGIYSCTEGLND
jgi:hypothetical protein